MGITSQNKAASRRNLSLGRFDRLLNECNVLTQEELRALTTEYRQLVTDTTACFSPAVKSAIKNNQCPLASIEIALQEGQLVFEKQLKLSIDSFVNKLIEKGCNFVLDGHGYVRWEIANLLGWYELESVADVRMRRDILTNLKKLADFERAKDVVCSFVQTALEQVVLSLSTVFDDPVEAQLSVALSQFITKINNNGFIEEFVRRSQKTHSFYSGNAAKFSASLAQVNYVFLLRLQSMMEKDFDNYKINFADSFGNQDILDRKKLLLEKNKKWRLERLAFWIYAMFACQEDNTFKAMWDFLKKYKIVGVDGNENEDEDGFIVVAEDLLALLRKSHPTAYNQYLFCLARSKHNHRCVVSKEPVETDQEIVFQNLANRIYARDKFRLVTQVLAEYKQVPENKKTPQQDMLVSRLRGVSIQLCTKLNESAVDTTALEMIKEFYTECCEKGLKELPLGRILRMYFNMFGDYLMLNPTVPRSLRIDLPNPKSDEKEYSNNRSDSSSVGESPLQKAKLFFSFFTFYEDYPERIHDRVQQAEKKEDVYRCSIGKLNIIENYCDLKLKR